MSTQQKQPPKGQSYAGPSGGLKKDAYWLASEDLGSREAVVVIEDVIIYPEVSFDKGRKELQVPALKFAGKAKQMILNSTNRKTLVRLFGKETKDWRGQTVTVYVDDNVTFGRETVSGLRIKGDPAKPGASLTSMLAGSASVCLMLAGLCLSGCATTPKPTVSEIHNLPPPFIGAADKYITWNPTASKGGSQ